MQLRPARPISDDAGPDLETRALEGDARAWSALVKRHNHRVVLSLLARGVRLDRAEELAQEAWLRLVEQQRQGRLSALSLPGLAIAQAAFLAGDAARRARRDDRVGAASRPDTSGPSAPSPESEALERERLEAARRALSSCPEQARRVFTFVHGNPELPHAAAARALGLSTQRVRQILCEVRARLRQAVFGADVDDVDRGGRRR